MKKKSFIVHDRETGEEILIASAAFCCATVIGENTTVITETNMFAVTESIQVIQSLYEETEG